jgi:hypothetical protein
VSYVSVKSQDGKSAEGAMAEEETEVDRTSDDDPDIEGRIG